jgi:hypothetical protein
VVVRRPKNTTPETSATESANAIGSRRGTRSTYDAGVALT